MNINKLLNKINFYFKKTAMVQVPNEILEPIVNYVLDCFLEEIEDSELELSDYDKYDFFKVKEKVSQEKRKFNKFKLSKSYSLDEHSIKFIFPIDMMPYYNNMTPEHFYKYFAKKYIEKNKEVPENIEKYKNLKNIIIYVKVFIGSGAPMWRETKKDSSILWASEESLLLGLLEIPIKITNNISEYIANLENSVQHEMIHFVQDYIAMMTNQQQKSGAGLPPLKSRVPNIDPMGRVINKENICKECGAKLNEFDKLCKECGAETTEGKIYKKYVIPGADQEEYEETKRISYSQQDVEYYPLIKDAATYDYPYLKNLLPSILHRDAISVFVGENSISDFKSKVKKLQEENKISNKVAEKILNINDNVLQNSFFAQWKEINTEKWKTAVKEFYKLISN